MARMRAQLGLIGLVAALALTACGGPKTGAAAAGPKGPGRSPS
jgi:hypothetical protein